MSECGKLSVQKLKSHDFGLTAVDISRPLSILEHIFGANAGSEYLASTLACERDETMFSTRITSTAQ